VGAETGDSGAMEVNLPALVENGPKEIRGARINRPAESANGQSVGTSNCA